MKAIFSILVLAIAMSFASDAQAYRRHGPGPGPAGYWHGRPGPNWAGPNHWNGHHRRPYYPRPILLPPPIMQPPVVVQPPIVTPPPIEQQVLVAPNQCPGGYVFTYGYGCQQQMVIQDLPCYQAAYDCQQPLPNYVPEQTYFCAPNYCGQAPATLPYPQYGRPMPLPGGYGIQAECRIVRDRRSGRFVVLQHTNNILPPTTASYQQAVQVLQSYRFQNVCR